MRPRWPASISPNSSPWTRRGSCLVGVIVPTQKVNQYLAAKAAQRQAALGRELTQEEQTALLHEEVLPDLGGDPEMAIKALESRGHRGGRNP